MRKKNDNSDDDLPILRQPMSPEAKENQMISLAMDLVEKRLRNGTATSQETTHFLKLATVNAQNERRLQEVEMELKLAKTEQIKSQKVQEEFYQQVLNAIRRYNGDYNEDEEGEQY